MRSAVGFLTIVGGARAPHARTLWWFPLVGAGIGAIVAGAHWVAHEWWHPLVAAALVVAIDLVITGGLHADGLADSADGLLPHIDTRRRLEVMATPDLGAFALVTVIVVVVLRWGVLADPGLPVLSIVALWATSRTCAAIVPAVVPYARPGGLATPFMAGATRWTALWLVPIVAVASGGAGVQGAVSIAAALIAAVAVVWLAKRRIGGFTGDVLGAVVILSETVGLVVLAADL